MQPTKCVEKCAFGRIFAHCSAEYMLSMRSLFLSILLLSAATLATFAQNHHAVEVEKAVYQTARKYGDAPQATSALYRLIALGETSYRDTLLSIYFANNAFTSSILLGRELFTERPEDLRLLEILAVSEQQMGLNEEALLHYTTLYRKSKDVYFLYQTATLQYQLSRKSECKLTIDDILANANAKTTNTTISYDNGASQEVPVAAAAINLRGAIFADEDNEALAMNSFVEALQLAGGKFKLASDNMAAIKQRIAKEAAENTAKMKANEAKPTETQPTTTSPK